MDFDLPPELAELQATVRKLAQERVAPRAREIDVTEEYPQDLFELFVETGLTGLCIPEELRRLRRRHPRPRDRDRGGLEVLQRRRAHAPAHPAAHRAAADRGERGAEAASTSRPLATGEQRAAFGLSEPQAGSDVMGMRTQAVPDGDDWVLTGTKCWMSRRAPGRLVLRLRQDRSRRLARPRQHHRVHRRARLGRRLGRPDRQEDGREGRRHRRAAARRRARAPTRTSSARSAGSGSACSGSTRCARSSRRAASGSPRAR